jgi:hypothetical protein
MPSPEGVDATFAVLLLLLLLMMMMMMMPLLQTMNLQPPATPHLGHHGEVNIGVEAHVPPHEHHEEVGPVLLLHQAAGHAP